MVRGRSGTLATMSDENPSTVNPPTWSAEDRFSPRPVLGALLYDEPPTVEAVIGAVTTIPGADELGITASPVEGEDGIIDVRLGKFGISALLTVFDAPVPGSEAVDNAHQLYCQGEERERVAAHAGQVLVAVRPEIEERTADQVRDLPGRQQQLVFSRVHGLMVVALTRMPGIAGYYSGDAAATFGTTFLHQVAAGEFGATPWPLWVSAWLQPGPTGVSGYTYGLWALGHPELQVENSTMPPEDLFLYLMDVAAYLVLDGGSFADGETTGRSERERFTIHADAWVVDQSVPAFRIDM
jgi:hypothetical protein